MKIPAVGSCARDASGAMNMSAAIGRVNGWLRMLRRLLRSDARSTAPPGCVLCNSHWMCRMLHMPTNLAIDDRLLEEARKVGGHKTKKDTVKEERREYIKRRKQVEILDL